MNEKFESYLKDLSPELQEKARECKTMEELNAFIAENNLELPEDALEMVSGGFCIGDCPKGGKHEWNTYTSYSECKKCGETLYHPS